MTETKYPKAVYAAAGVGDFVYEQLKKLQDKAATVDTGKVREQVLTRTQEAAVKAEQVYLTLVSRGEKAFASKGDAPRTTEPAPDAPKKAAPRKKAA
jgi:hypothetical protein